MSLITKLILCVAGRDQPDNNAEAWDWLIQTSSAEVVRALVEGFVSPHACEVGKGFSDGVYLAAFNYRTDEIEALANDIDFAPWKQPELVQLLARSEARILGLSDYDAFRPVNHRLGCPMRAKDGIGVVVACSLKADHAGHCKNARGEFITTGAPMAPAQRRDFMRNGA